MNFEKLHLLFQNSPFRLFCYGSVRSTNDTAKSLCPQSTPCLVVAQRQTAGKGRRGRVWASDGENLYASFLFPQALPANATLAAALSVADTLSMAGGVQIKWPNDILVHGKKICGILTEQRTCRETCHTIIGIGINVFQTTFPKELCATSLALEYPNFYEIEVLASALASHLYNRVRTLTMYGFGAMREEYTAKSSLLHKEITATNTQGTLCGICKGFGDDGSLLLDTGASTERIFFGEATLRHPGKE